MAMAPNEVEVKIPENMSPFVVIVNGVEYSYPAGTTQMVPEEVAEVIGQHVEAMPKPMAPSGGGGGAGAFIVHLIYVDDGPTTVDKTFAEISQAVKSGMDVRLVYEEEDYVSISYLVNWEADFMARFASIFHTGNNNAEVSTVYVEADGTVREYFTEINMNAGGGPS